MTKVEMDAVVNIMNCIWDTAYLCGMCGLLKPDITATDYYEEWKENHEYRDKHIAKRIEAAGIKID